MLAKLNDTDHTLFLGDKQIAQGRLGDKLVYEVPIPAALELSIYWAFNYSNQTHPEMMQSKPGPSGDGKVKGGGTYSLPDTPPDIPIDGSQDMMTAEGDGSIYFVAPEKFVSLAINGKDRTRDMDSLYDGKEILLSINDSLKGTWSVITVGSNGIQHETTFKVQ